MSSWTTWLPQNTKLWSLSITAFLFLAKDINLQIDVIVSSNRAETFCDDFRHLCRLPDLVWWNLQLRCPCRLRTLRHGRMEIKDQMHIVNSAVVVSREYRYPCKVPKLQVYGPSLSDQTAFTADMKRDLVHVGIAVIERLPLAHLLPFDPDMSIPKYIFRRRKLGRDIFRRQTASRGR